MKRFLLPAFLFALLVAVLFVGVQRAPQKTVIPSALIGKPAPDFTLPVLGSSESFSESAMRGRWYLLNVWGTWSEPALTGRGAADQTRGPFRPPNWKGSSAG